MSTRELLEPGRFYRGAVKAGRKVRDRVITRVVRGHYVIFAGAFVPEDYFRPRDARAGRIFRKSADRTVIGLPEYGGYR